MPTFRVNAIPVAQPRQRHRIVNGAKGMFASNYTPKDDPVNAFKAQLRIAAQQAGITPLEGPLSVTLWCYFPRPKGHYRKSGDVKPKAPAFKVSKPDHDNLAKSICDALNAIAWQDDAQIVDARTIKRYATPENPVGVEIIIREITE